MKFKDAYEACDALRCKDLTVKLPLLLFWQSVKNQHHWTCFARNGRIIGASSEGFSSAAIASRNYDLNFEQIEHTKAYWI